MKVFTKHSYLLNVLVLVLYSFNLVTPNTSPNLTVAHDGSGDYTTITEAINASPCYLKTRFTIYVKMGIYNEHVYIPSNRTQLALVGDGMKLTFIIGSRSNASGYMTNETATVGVDGNGFMAKDIAIVNRAGPKGGQAVALRSQSDMSVFYRCSIQGYQDTLFVQTSRQLYCECDIYGTIDVIFGMATVVLQNCNIYAMKPLPLQNVTLTADGSNTPGHTTGIVIHKCNILATRELRAVQSSIQSFLGRPWKSFSTTIIIHSFIGDFIDPKGWSMWNGRSTGLDTLFYAEYDNYGPGSNTMGRVKWPGFKAINNRMDVANFTVDNFIKGSEWLPMTGVPYIPGLI